MQISSRLRILYESGCQQEILKQITHETCSEKTRKTWDFGPIVNWPMLEHQWRSGVWQNGRRWMQTIAALIGNIAVEWQLCFPLSHDPGFFGGGGVVIRCLVSLKERCILSSHAPDCKTEVQKYASNKPNKSFYFHSEFQGKSIKPYWDLTLTRWLKPLGCKAWLFLFSSMMWCEWRVTSQETLFCLTVNI